MSSGISGADHDRTQAAREYYVSPAGVDYAVYTHPVYGFSFNYPKDFTVAEIDDPRGEVILFTNPAYDMGLQVFMQPFDEPAEALTLARIRRDVPELAGAEAVESYLGRVDIPVVRFAYRDPVIGSIREAWFVHRGVLYQIMMHAPGEELLDGWFREFLVND